MVRFEFLEFAAPRRRRSPCCCWGLVLLCLALGAAGGHAASPPSLQLEISHRGVQFNWSDPARDFGYTVETRESFGPGTAWVPAPAAIWPSAWTNWTDAGLLRTPTRFYRAVASPAAAERGKLLSATDAGEVSPEEIRAVFATLPVPVEVGTGVRLYKLTYETINPFGLRTVASGLVVIPAVITNSAPLVSYQHGTIVVKDEVPSVAPGLDRAVGIAFGTTGYVAAMTDYLGLGDSPGLHPYVHARSEATAAIDLLRATRTYCESNSISLNGQLFLVGYSEGGHATMATHRELETHYTNEFTVTASAPMAGPYDLSGTMVEDFLSDRQMGSPYYLLYLLAAYNNIYHFAPSLSDLFKSPYDHNLPPLLDGRHDGNELDRAMGTSVPVQILKPEIVESLRNDPNHPLRAALRENDLYNWSPRAPIRMFHCAGDRDVLFANSQVAYDTLHTTSAGEVKLIDPMPSATHGVCAPFAFVGAKAWFDTLANR